MFPALVRVGLFGLGLAFALAACSRVEPRVPYPHESILTIVAELKLFLEQDPYTQPPGTDLEGRNIYRVSLERLAQLDQLLDPGYADVVDFARGECLERMGEWEAAAAAFTQAGATTSTLAAEAMRRAAQATRLGELTDRTRLTPTLEGYLNDLEVMQQELRTWSAQSPAWPMEALINLERERAQEEYARLLFTNRMILENGIERALNAQKTLCTEHTRSARAMQHQIGLGTMFESLARDWSSRNRPEETGLPEGSDWANWIEAAREAYRKAALADGDPAKPEAQARLRALDAYALRIQSLAR